MPSIEELLGDDEETETPAAPDKANAAFAQQRKELAALKKEAEELRAFKAEREQADRKATVSETFKALGLNPKHSGWFPGDQEASEDAVKAWALENELISLAEGEAPPEPEARGFTPTVIADGAPLGSKVYTQEEFEALLRTDENRAMQLYQSGKVQMGKLSELGGESIHRV